MTHDHPHRSNSGAAARRHGGAHAIAMCPGARALQPWYRRWQVSRATARNGNGVSSGSAGAGWARGTLPRPHVQGWTRPWPRLRPQPRPRPLHPRPRPRPRPPHPRMHPRPRPRLQPTTTATATGAATANVSTAAGTAWAASGIAPASAAATATGPTLALAAATDAAARTTRASPHRAPDTASRRNLSGAAAAAGTRSSTARVEGAGPAGAAGAASAAGFATTRAAKVLLRSASAAAPCWRPATGPPRHRLAPWAALLPPPAAACTQRACPLPCRRQPPHRGHGAWGARLSRHGLRLRPGRGSARPLLRVCGQPPRQAARAEQGQPCAGLQPRQGRGQ